MAERFPALDSALKEPANELRRWESTGESTSRSESCQRQPPHRCKGGADPQQGAPFSIPTAAPPRGRHWRRSIAKSYWENAAIFLMLGPATWPVGGLSDQPDLQERARAPQTTEYPT